ncbi:hypothetical protein BEH94_03960 [Candidatus Altiarchaeales archaeon WOR_SM1_SCG]|nr:hypothetical protein BEH94_03960 [Candidatus Altiarchaeales archaeon WOR_SM1_SCG]
MEGRTTTGKRVYTNPIWVNVYTLDSDGDGLCNYRDQCDVMYGDYCNGCPEPSCPSGEHPECFPSGPSCVTDPCLCSDGTSSSSATTVYDETATTCCLDDSHAERWYKIDVSSSGDLYIELFDFGSNDFDLYLYNSSLSLIGSSAGTTPTEEINKSVPSGTYYIKVSQWSGKGEFKLYVDFDPEFYGCVGATEIFTCGEVVTESCTFNADLNCTGDALTVTSDDITIDCDGRTLNGTGSDAGIVVYGNNATIKNCKVFNYSYGIVLWESSNNSILNNIVSNNERGIWLGYSSNNNIINNNVISNFQGIWLENSSDNNITNNIASNNTLYGICLYSPSENNNVIRNIVSLNHIGIFIYPSSNSNSIINNIASSNDHGIFLWNSSGNTIKENMNYNNTNRGITLSNSSNNNLTENLICENGLDLSSDNISSNYGDENTCNTTEKWDDSSKEGCAYSCMDTPDIKINKTLVNYFPDTGVVEYNITVKNKDYKNTHDLSIKDLLPYGNYSVFDVNIGSDCDEYIGARLIGAKIGEPIGAKIGEPIGAKIGEPIGTPGCSDYSLYYPDQYNLSESPVLLHDLKNLYSFQPSSKCTINFKVNATNCPYTETNFTNTALASISNYNLTFNATSIASINCSSKPDLTVTKLVPTKEHPECGTIIETSFLIGENITFYMDIENLDELYASSLETTNISLLVFEGSDLRYEDYKIINLKEIYELYDLSFSWIPENAGVYIIKIKVDSVNNISELNETNNELDIKLVVYHVCDLNHDGIIIHDYDDLMTAYKCFLGIKNCDNYYMNWNLMKQEYQCFTGNFN